MLEALSRTASRYPKRMGLLAILVFVLAGVFGAPAAGMLNARNPFSDPVPKALGPKLWSSA